jgi:hypothetical protein
MSMRGRKERAVTKSTPHKPCLGVLEELIEMNLLVPRVDETLILPSNMSR